MACSVVPPVGGRGILTCPVWAALNRTVVAGACLQERGDLHERCATAGAQKAIIAACDAPLWQDMLADASDARFGGKRQGFPCLAPVLRAAAGDVPVFERCHAVGGESSAPEGGRSVRTSVPVPAGAQWGTQACVQTWGGT